MYTHEIIDGVLLSVLMAVTVNVLLSFFKHRIEGKVIMTLPRMRLMLYASYFLLALTCVLGIFSMARADTINWTPTLEREDGALMTIDEVRGYRVYYSDGVSGAYPNVIDITGANTTTATIPDSTIDIHVVVTTVDTGGRESAYSLEHLIPATVSTNNPPTGYWLASTSKEITAGDSMTVAVGASDADGTIASVSLYLNDQFVRTEVKVPYTWNAGADAVFSNMAAGDYMLKAVITDNGGASVTITRALKVVALPMPPIVQ